MLRGVCIFFPSGYYLFFITEKDESFAEMPFRYSFACIFYTTGLLTTLKTRVIIVARKQRGIPSGKEIQMFNLRFVKTVTEYERYDMLRHDDDSFNKVRSYENGKIKRLNMYE